MSHHFVIAAGKTFNGDRQYRGGDRIPLADETGFIVGVWNLGATEARFLTEQGVGRVVSSRSGLVRGSSVPDHCHGLAGKPVQFRE